PGFVPQLKVGGFTGQDISDGVQVFGLLDVPGCDVEEGTQRCIVVTQGSHPAIPGSVAEDGDEPELLKFGLQLGIGLTLNRELCNFIVVQKVRGKGWKRCIREETRFETVYGLAEGEVGVG